MWNSDDEYLHSLNMYNLRLIQNPESACHKEKKKQQHEINTTIYKMLC